MKIVEQPALTEVFPIDGTMQDKIKYLKDQISELKQQKKCYDKMIKKREKAIKYLIQSEQFKIVLKEF